MNLSNSWSKAVVTGAGGFIGRQLVKELRQRGIDTIGVDRKEAGQAGSVTHTLDIGQPDGIEKLLDRDTALFHLAGSANVIRSVESPIDDFIANVPTSIVVLDAARRTGSPLVVFPSTGSVYDPDFAGPYNENSPTRPSSPYGAAKIACEAYCLAYARSYGLNTRIARLFSVYGPGMRRFAIYDFYQRLARNTDRLVLRGDGRQRRDYMHVSDAARALIHIAVEGKIGEIYNVASGKALTMREVATEVARAMGLPSCDIAVDGVVNPAEIYTMDADVRKLLGIHFEACYNFEEGLAETVDWLRLQANE